jgi:hypothetical protein
MAMSGVMAPPESDIRITRRGSPTLRDGVFVDVAVMNVVQMPVVEIVDVIVVADREVSTVVSVNVAVILACDAEPSWRVLLVRVLAAVVVVRRHNHHRSINSSVAQMKKGDRSRRGFGR